MTDFSDAVSIPLRSAAAALLALDANDRFERLRNWLIASSEERFGDGAYLFTRYPTPSDLAAALESGDPKVLAFAPGLLGEFDPKSAVDFADALTRIPKVEHTGRFDAHAVSSAHDVLTRFPIHVPFERLLELGFEEKIYHSLVSHLLERPELRAPGAALELFDRMLTSQSGAGNFKAALRKALASMLAKSGDVVGIAKLTSLALTADHPFARIAFQELHIAGTRAALGAIADRLEALSSDPAAPEEVTLQAMQAALRIGDGVTTAAAAGRVAFLSGGRASDVDAARAKRYLDSARFYAERIKDPSAWIALAASALGDERLSISAKHLLGVFPAKDVNAELARVGFVSAKIAPRRGVVPAKLDFLARYERGEHEAVWSELDALGAAVFDPPVLVEARAVGLATMRRAAANLARIAKSLAQAGYPLARKKNAFVPAKGDAAKKLDAIEKLVKGPIPIAVRCFYEIVAEVSFAEDTEFAYDGSCPHEMWGSDFDPLVVFPLSKTVPLLKQLNTEREAIPRALRDPHELRLGPSRAVKYDVDNDADDDPLRIVLPDPFADSKVRGTPGDISFVDLLRRVVQGGGFLLKASAPDDAVMTPLRAGLTPF